MQVAVGREAVRRAAAEHGSITKMTLADIESVAEDNNGDPSWVGDRLLIRCPLHGDNGPSLQASETGGRLLFHCFGACDDSEPQWLPELADWLNDPSPLPKPKGGTLRATGGSGKTTKGKSKRLPWWEKIDSVEYHGKAKPGFTEHRHPYRDEDGKVIALKLRYRLDDGRKGMIWTTPNSSFHTSDADGLMTGTGVASRINTGIYEKSPYGLGVTLGLNGRKEADLPLYRDGDLWDLTKGTTVYVVESESSVDRAWSSSIPATCAAGGASSKPPKDLSALDDLDVVLVPDRDDAGERWLERWLERLPDARVGRIPDAVEDEMRKAGKDPKGADLRDLLESPRLGIKDLDMATAEEAMQSGEPDDDEYADELEENKHRELLRLRARRWAEQQVAAEELNEARGPRVKRTAEDFSALPPVPVVMEDILAAEMNLLGGPAEAGKSLWARDLSLHVASGMPWRGHAVPEQRNVLWVASEGLNDFRLRWESQPLWSLAKPNIYVLDEPVNLVQSSDVEWLLREYADERPGLVVFDVVYGMGMADDTGTKDVFPVINSMKRISKEWGGATLALGHPPHSSSGSRRFRGSSSWRQLAYVEWHMNDGELSCEKSKITNKATMSDNYALEYPDIEWLTTASAGGSTAAGRDAAITAHIKAYPDESDSKVAQTLAPGLGIKPDYLRKVVARVRKTL